MSDKRWLGFNPGSFGWIRRHYERGLEEIAQEDRVIPDGLKHRMIETFTLAAHCERWEWQESRAQEFFDVLDEYIEARILSTIGPR